MKIAIALLAALAAGAARADELAARILGEAIASGRAMNTVEELAETIGPRSTGTAACARAQRWVAGQLKSDGYEPREEGYALGWSWDPGPWRLAVTQPLERELTAMPFHGAPGTPAGGVEGDLVELEKFEPLPEDLKGKIALISPRKAGARSRAEILVKLARLNEALHAAGALGLLVAIEGNPRSITTRNDNDSKNAPLPQLSLALADARVLKRLSGAKPVRLHLSSGARVGERGEAANVVAELPGSGSNEIVALLAHLDSVGYAPGATDNGAGVAAVLEAARVLRAMGAKPRRTIRFVLTTGEEQGLLGAAAYLARHSEELDRHAAVIALDGGPGRVTGLSGCGRKDLAAAIARAIEPLRASGLRDASGTDEQLRECMGTDSQAFLVAGVPTFGVPQLDTKSYMDVMHHRAADTPDKVQPLDLGYNAAVLALSALQLANIEGQIGKRLSPKEVVELLQKNKTIDDVAPALRGLLGSSEPAPALGGEPR
jgi:hypothetical protein